VNQESTTDVTLNETDTSFQDAHDYDYDTAETGSHQFQLESGSDAEGIEEIGQVVSDRVPERVFYSPQSEEDAGDGSRKSPLINFNENDEDLLGMLGPSELEHLEAWTGKYL